jgi:hypothetical protein
MTSSKFGLVLGILLTAAVAYTQQVTDPTFDAKVAQPAYTKTHPKILFDEAHNNFHTSTGRYKPFADLITNDGYSITPGGEKFSRKTLEGFDVLIIVNALGAERQNLPEASQPAFTETECDAVRDWVKTGGSLLLVADHAPFGAAAEIMAQRFNVEMSKGHTSDPDNHDSETGNMSFLAFTRANNLLLGHAITDGRGQTERINKVISFTGQSLKGPAGSVPFLRLSDSALDLNRQAREATADTKPIDRLPDGRPLPPGVTARASSGAGVPRTSAAGRAQALAFEFGKGRVVVLGEAAMLSAQVVKGPAAQLMGREEFQIGMNRPGIDNRQLGLNIMHWLSRLLASR